MSHPMWITFLLLLTPAGSLLAQPAIRSHPPLRKAPPPASRPLAKGPAYHVDASRGDDRADGSLKTPWRTVNHALHQLKPGDTLYLRGGVYHENVYLALAGRKDAPITLRSYPGEQAILDGGLADFVEDPAAAWEPHPKGARGYRSRRRYPNLRNVAGSFGDSMVGLQTYYHARDFRSENDSIDWEDWARIQATDIKPLYCGPGLWYDRDSGLIHVRLAHTHLPAPVANYKGETDPRKLPLVIAPYHSVVLRLDQARHVQLQDLVIRGAGYTAVVMDQCDDVTLDNVTIWCGAYGIRATGTQHLRILRSGLHGNVAPWTFRSDGSKRDYPGRPHRNISRMNTHALLEIDAGRESSVYATPLNDHWEIAYSDFTDAHDGLYLGAINVRFHHNLIENLQDDGLYLSPMYHRHRLEKTDPEIHIYENVFRQQLTALAFGGSEPATRDRILIYRNLFDLRGQVNTGRPSVKSPMASFSTGKVIGDHGSPPWPTMDIYHNTFAMSEARQADMATFAGSGAGNPRRVYNNLFLHLDRLPGFVGPAGKLVADGNLFWSPKAEAPALAAFFKRYPGSSTHSLAIDPNLVGVAAGDYRLQAGSPAVDAGVAVPEEWPDPLRKHDRGKPDIGALPLDAKSLAVGRAAP